jgi:hypothetical protein
MNNLIRFLICSLLFFVGVTVVTVSEGFANSVEGTLLPRTAKKKPRQEVVLFARNTLNETPLLANEQRQPNKPKQDVASLVANSRISLAAPPVPLLERNLPPPPEQEGAAMVINLDVVRF